VKAAEIKGKRFVVLRDPWGEPGWQGAWSDGSKEWTKEWLEILPELGHSFGSRGQFVMECECFFGQLNGRLTPDGDICFCRFGFLECVARNSENDHF
jgi:hypothetical protein